MRRSFSPWRRTHRGIKGADRQETGALSARGDGRDVEAGDVAPELLLLRLEQLPGSCQLKVDDLAAGHGHDDLALVGGRPHDRLAAGGPPLIDAPVTADVPQAAGMHLRAIAV